MNLPENTNSNYNLSVHLAEVVFYLVWPFLPTILCFRSSTIIKWQSFSALHPFMFLSQLLYPFQDKQFLQLLA